MGRNYNLQITNYKGFFGAKFLWTEWKSSPDTQINPGIQGLDGWTKVKIRFETVQRAGEFWAQSSTIVHLIISNSKPTNFNQFSVRFISPQIQDNIYQRKSVTWFIPPGPKQSLTCLLGGNIWGLPKSLKARPGDLRNWEVKTSISSLKLFQILMVYTKKLPDLSHCSLFSMYRPKKSSQQI